MRPTGRAALHRALLASLVVLAACGDPEPPPYAGGAPSSALDLAGRESPGMPRPVGTHCYNCVKDVDETDVDCGGSCRPCPGWVPTFECEDIQRAPRCGCYAPCAGNEPASCRNGARDGSETDVDCGGGGCPYCTTGKSCARWQDCASGNCVAGRCSATAPSCSDGIVNGFENEVDCGSLECKPCPDGSRCGYESSRCTSGNCIDGRCVANTCKPRFDGGTRYPVSGPYLVADFDGDGKRDIAIAHQPGKLGLLHNKGNGTFDAVAESAAVWSGTPDRLSAADWNGDGVIDVAASVTGGALVPLANDGLGHFRPIGAPFANVPDATSLVMAGDFDGDRRTDLVTMGRLANSATAINTYQGRGDGTFGPAKLVDQSSGNQNFNSLHVEHGVGRDALAYIVDGIGDHHLGSGFHGGFPPRLPGIDIHYATAFPLIQGYWSADIDGDGWDDEFVHVLDNVLCMDNGGDAGQGKASAAAWNGFFNQVATYPSAVGDFNGDGNLDYATGDTIHCGDGRLMFSAGVKFVLPGDSVPDLNGDNKADLISVKGGTLTVFLNRN